MNSDTTGADESRKPYARPVGTPAFHELFTQRVLKARASPTGTMNLSYEEMLKEPIRLESEREAVLAF